MINRVVLVGRITKDPELKMTQSNIPVVSFTLAVNRNFTGHDGEKETDFIRCVVWRRQAENLAEYIRQGALLGVEGRIQTGSYEGDHGTVYTTDVVCDSIQFLESKGSRDEAPRYIPQQQNQSLNNDQEKGGNGQVFETAKNLVADDDLPF